MSAMSEINGKSSDALDPPPSLCWNCKHGIVLVVARLIDPESAVSGRDRTEISNCSNPMIAPADEPAVFPDPVLECQGFEGRVFVQRERRSARKKRSVKKYGRKHKRSPR